MNEESSRRAILTVAGEPAARYHSQTPPPRRCCRASFPNLAFFSVNHGILLCATSAAGAQDHRFPPSTHSHRQPRYQIKLYHQPGGEWQWRSERPPRVVALGLTHSASAPRSAQRGRPLPADFDDASSPSQDLPKPRCEHEIKSFQLAGRRGWTTVCDSTQKVKRWYYTSQAMAMQTKRAQTCDEPLAPPGREDLARGSPLRY